VSIIDGRPGRYIGIPWTITCVLCNDKQQLKNMNEEAAGREAARKGWRQLRDEDDDHGPACPDCLKAATGKDPREED
jgi:hypothetical protein